MIVMIDGLLSSQTISDIVSIAINVKGMFVEFKMIFKSNFRYSQKYKDHFKISENTFTSSTPNLPLS